MNNRAAEQLKLTLVRLYDTYGVDKTKLDQMSPGQVAQGVKGLLAELDLNKSRQCTVEDKKQIQQIYFNFC